MEYARYPSLVGRVVFVTGGASGIGADIVRAFAGNGCRVAFVDIQDDAGNALCEEIGATNEHRPVYYHCDVTDPDALQAAVRRVGEEIGPIGVLVNNAANDERHALDDITSEYWDSNLGINLKPHFFAAQAVRPQMRALGGGAIINFSSIAWRGGADGMAAYATAKAAIQGLTRALARGFGDDNIRVNAIEPGAVMTERQRKLWYQSEESVQAIVGKQVIRRVLLGEDIARTALFLASDDAGMITKQSFVVDAGLSS
jgi:NAD(P)-dependent dehydrogenase (short-subunit alcohol dehydrogenase family)